MPHHVGFCQDPFCSPSWYKTSPSIETLISTNHLRRAPFPSVGPKKIQLVKEVECCSLARWLFSFTSFVETAGWKKTNKQVPSILKIPVADPLVLLTPLKVIELVPNQGLSTTICLCKSTIAVRHTQTFPFLFQKDTKSAPNKSLKSPTSHQGKSLNYCATKATTCIISLHTANLSKEIKRKACSINIAVWTTQRSLLDYHR